MKKSILTGIIMIPGLLTFMDAACQNSSSRIFADNFTTGMDNITPGTETTMATDAFTDAADVIDMEMIRSFRKDTTTSHAFFLTDYYRRNANDLSLIFMAYLRTRLENHGLETESLIEREIKSIRSEMATDSKHYALLAYTEKPANSTRPAVTKKPVLPQTNASEHTKKAGPFMWIHLKK